MPSGAYTFRPNGTVPHKVTTEGGIKVTVYKGEPSHPFVITFVIFNLFRSIFQGALVEEIHQYYNEWLSQVIRLYRGQSNVELDWIVGSIPTKYVIIEKYNLTK